MVCLPSALVQPVSPGGLKAELPQKVSARGTELVPIPAPFFAGGSPVFWVNTVFPDRFSVFPKKGQTDVQKTNPKTGTNFAKPAGLIQSPSGGGGVPGDKRGPRPPPYP